ncbi:MAG: hypothetical protein ACW99A_09585 [Candidatus Kariarchaeaceae archaeon]|jgi:hypothetical protein
MDLSDVGLKDLYVLRDTGECVFYQNYSDSADQPAADEVIISSFLSAIETFSANVDNGTSMLETTNYRFVYHRKEEYLYVARTEKRLNPKDVYRRLNNISEEVNKWAPKKFDGSIKIFQGISGLVVQHFDNSVLQKYYEITGKDSKELKGVESKIYSFLRFRGRAKLSDIAKLMRIPEKDAKEVTQRLLSDEYVSSCS